MRLAWRTAGGLGDPPEQLWLTFAIYLSGFATHALMTDFDQTPAQIGVLTADILKMALGRALQEQRAAIGEQLIALYERATERSPPRVTDTPVSRPGLWP